MMDKWESESSKILSFQQLHAASKEILGENNLKVARQLGLNSKDLDIIKSRVKQHPLAVSPGDEMLRILEAWKDKYPEKCTLEDLTNALILLKFLQTAEKVKIAIEGLKSKNKLLDEDKKCFKNLKMNEDLAIEVSNIVPAHIYTSLGFTLGLERGQIDEVELTCKANNSPSEYVLETLKKWIEQDGEPYLGKLYRALRMFDLNANANKVYDKCIAIAPSENPGNARSEPDLK